jgi:ABC-type transporter Mla subunit MlaD
MENLWEALKTEGSYFRFDPGLFTEFFGYIFHPVTPLAVFINSVILFIAGLILLWILLQLIRITVAYWKFSRFRYRILKEKDRIWKEPEIDRLARKWNCRHPWLLKRLSTVRKLRDDTNATIDALEDIDADLRWWTYGVLKYPNASLIVLGLLGTVWGLQKAIHSMLPTVQGELDLERLKMVMVGTLSGMQTAFATTLAGLFCSVVIGFIITILLKGYLDKFLASVKSFLVNSIIPIYSLLGSEHLQSLAEQTKELKESVASVVEQSDLLFQPIIESAENIKSGMDQIHSAAHSFVAASEGMRVFNETLSGNLQTLTDTLNEVNASVTAFNRVQTDIDRTLKDIAALPEHFESLMKSLTGEFVSHQDRLRREQNQAFAEKLEALSGIVEGMSGTVDTWRKDTEAAKGVLTETAEGSVGRLTDEVSALLTRVAESGTRLEDTNRTLAESLETLKTQQAAVGERYLKTFGEQTETMKTALTEMVSRSREDQTHIQRQVIDAIAEWVAYNRYLSRLLEGLDQLPNRIAREVKN